MTTKTANSTTATLVPEYTSYDLALLAALAADDRKAGEAVLIDISEISLLADYLLIVSGYSKVQLRAICGSIIEKIELELDHSPLRTEGENQGGWVLIDYGDLIVHIMMPEQREFYDLESFWSHGKTISLPESL